MFRLFGYLSIKDSKRGHFGEVGLSAENVQRNQDPAQSVEEQEVPERTIGNRKQFTQFVEIIYKVVIFKLIILAHKRQL